jgi:AcrR family transcriptional regulator
LAVNRDHDVRTAFGDPGAAGTGGGPASDPGAEARPPAGEDEPAGTAGPEGDGRAARAQARREQRRSTILAAATRVFKEKGYHAASVHDIIDAAQIARGTFYLYFTSKREVFAELSSAFLALIRGSVRKISLDPADGEPLAQMRANFRRVMNTVLDHRDLASIMLRGDAGDAEARAQLGHFYDQVVELIGQAVRVGHALGIARDCDVQVIGVAALAGLKEVLGRMLDARDGSPGDPAPDGPGASARPPQGPDPAAPSAGAPWRMPPEVVADELLTFFVRGVFTHDAR